MTQQHCNLITAVQVSGTAHASHPLVLVWHELSQVRSLPWAAQAECSGCLTEHMQAPAPGRSPRHVKQMQVALLSIAWRMPV